MGNIVSVGFINSKLGISNKKDRKAVMIELVHSITTTTELPDSTQTVTSDEYNTTDSRPATGSPPAVSQQLRRRDSSLMTVVTSRFRNEPRLCVTKSHKPTITNVNR